MKISDIFQVGSPGEDWCRDQRNQAERAGSDISEMDCSYDGVHYADPRSPNAAQWN